ncbi:ABC-2 type transport system ATP-binding protein [Actinokineospora alba]|uniref:ABC-2 type transport system ATP-binding protein n=1 Tax=Actinokineospora alba TaxID=504798 RepID=A0A1H0FTY8_9PSEU|nr:ABC transporter ATP-binding protein [Actinokineospora alba]TDP69613.1 ABC-2 type transport system ATP-binding protein [Actinokineospora alba]SDI12940.1 ABC-2 type transport system ATP-binding protein [Actinokineospora alba]SDN98044.1 ABC-2 type transport system ATP-binding protein [Actinokineospora alba]
MIEIDALTKVYDQVKAVDDVSMHIPAGSVFGFLGPNGAGKTTTIKVLAGLLTPTSGEVRLGGYDVVRQRSAAMAQFGAVLEGSRNVYWSLSAWQNLMYFGRLKGLRKARVRDRAEELLTDLGLWERRRDKVGGFSRGMQQKVAIAAALIADPPIVLLDEPTLGLDVEATRTVKGWIADLARDRGTTILLTTHQLDVAQELCDRVAVMRQGRLVADLPTRDLLARFRERDKYEIRVEGAPPPGFDAVTRDGVTTISVRVADPREVYDVVERLRVQGAVLESLNQVQPDLEDVFLALVNEVSHA